VTRAVSVVIERSPGGGSGFSMQFGDQRHFAMPCTEFRALDWVRERLEASGAERSERGRVLRLLIRELDRKQKAIVTAEVTAEVPACLVDSDKRKDIEHGESKRNQDSSTGTPRVEGATEVGCVGAKDRGMEAKGEPARIGMQVRAASGALSHRLRFAPLVAAEPSETISALAAAAVRLCAEAEFEGEPTVNERGF